MSEIEPSQRIKTLADATRREAIRVGLPFDETRLTLAATIAYLDEQHAQQAALPMSPDTTWDICVECGAYVPAGKACSNHAQQAETSATGKDNANRWRQKYHLARREVRRLNAALRVAGLLARTQASSALELRRALADEKQLADHVSEENEALRSVIEAEREAHRQTQAKLEAYKRELSLVEGYNDQLQAVNATPVDSETRSNPVCECGERLEAHTMRDYEMRCPGLTRSFKEATEMEKSPTAG